MQVVLLPPAPPPPVPSPFCLPSSDLSWPPWSAAAEATAEDVLGGGGGGPEDDWTSLAWLVLLVLEREDVVDSDRWAGVEPSWGFLLLLSSRLSSRLSSSSGSLLSPELHSSLTLSLSLWRAMSASSSWQGKSVSVRSVGWLQLTQPVPQCPAPHVAGRLHVVVVDVAPAAVSLQAAVALLGSALLLPVELQRVSRVA